MQCKGTARSGERCRRSAIKGGMVCKSHGGASPQAKNAASRRLAEAEASKAMRLFAAPVDVDPGQALVDLVKWTAGECEYWREQVRQLDAEFAADPDASLTWGKTREKIGGEDYGSTFEAAPAVEYRMLTDASDRLAKYATAALRAGVQERQIKLAEDQGSLVAEAIRRILDALDLTADQQAKVPEVVPGALRLVAGGN